MALRQVHELHTRRYSRNVGVGLALVAFVAVMFGLSVVKVRTVGAVEGFDHIVRPALENVE